jgi:ElaB/YqjD/DUF883 family membrane-anchored ribosome-binding protein
MQQENQVPGGAGPALAAHSKDASAPGSPQARHTAPQSGSGSESGGWSGGAAETARGLADRAREAASQAAGAASRMTQNLSQNLSGTGARAQDAVAAFIQEKPVTALAVTAVVCVVLGALIGRRS